MSNNNKAVKNLPSSLGGITSSKTEEQLVLVRQNVKIPRLLEQVLPKLRPFQREVRTCKAT